MTIKKGTSTIATSGSTTWGGLEGTLSDQTDLQNALDAKASTLSPNFSGIPTAPTASEGTNTTQIATTAFVKNAVDNIDALPDQTDMEGKYLATDGINAYWKSPAGLPLLSHIWSDHLLNDASFLRADTFSWQSGLVYKSAYNHLLDDIANGTPVTETVGSNSITYILAPDGHKIAQDETSVVNIYNETGVAWYYVLNVANQRFKLPRELPITDKSKGNGMSLGMTDGSNNVALSGQETTGLTRLNAVTSGYGNSVGTAPGGVATNRVSLGVTTDQTKSGIISHRANENGQQYLYFYVGNTIRNETEIDVGEITEALDGKLDQDLSNASANFKETIVGWGMPDYSAGVSLNGITSPYTAPKDGVIIVERNIGTVYVNGNYAATLEQVYSSYSVFIPVSSGDIVSWTQGTPYNGVFYPLKGV